MPAALVGVQGTVIAALVVVALAASESRSAQGGDSPRHSRHHVPAEQGWGLHRLQRAG
jgi:hypothetical protein